MNNLEAVEKLKAGETIRLSRTGNSMAPRIKSGQTVTIRPVAAGTIPAVGDVVFCKVRGNFYIHLVQAVDPKRGWHITNLRGRSNGWTWQVYGTVDA